MGHKVQETGAFRFTYFTDKYAETLSFYKEKLGLRLEHSWDREEHDKGALFRAGMGLIEILHRSNNGHRHEGLDYRQPQGAFMCIQVGNLDELFQEFKSAEVPFKEEVTEQPWGHRSFSVLEPNGLVLFFFQEPY